MSEYLDRMREKKSESSYLTRMRERNAQNALNELNQGMESISSIVGGIYNDTYERYKNGNDTYRADSKDWLDKTNSAQHAYDVSLAKVTSVLDDYDGVFDPEWSNNIRNAMSAYSEGIKKITENAEQENGFWSQFTEESYNDYKSKTTADLDKLSAEIKDLEATWQKANKYSTDRVSPTYWGKLLSDKGYSGDRTGLDQLQADIEEKKAYLNSASMYQGKGESADLAKLIEIAQSSPDYDKLSAEGAAIQNPSYNEAMPSSIFRRAQTVENPVTFSRENYDAYALSGGQYVPESFNKSYHYMNEEEVSAYDYYLAAEKAGLVEPGTAQKFLDTAQDVLNQREGEGFIERLPDNVLGDLLVGIYAGGEQFTSGIEGFKQIFKDWGKDYSSVPVSAGEYALSAWQQNLPDNFGGKVRKGITDLTSTVVNQVPSIMASTIISGIASPAVGETVGVVTMGAGAAGNAYNQFIRSGYTTQQARGYATLIGLSETCLEKLIGGISAFGAGGAKLSDRVIEQICSGVSKASQRIAIQQAGHFIAEMGSEALEEFTQDVLEPYFQALVTGGKPEAVDWEQAAYSGLLGALSAGLLNSVSGGTQEIQTRINAQDIVKAGNALELKNLVAENFSGTAQEYAKQLGKNPTANQVATLLREVNSSFENEIVSNLEDALMQSGKNRAEAHQLAEKLGNEIITKRYVTVDNLDPDVQSVVENLLPSLSARFNAMDTIGGLSYHFDNEAVDAKSISPTILSGNTDTAYDIAQTIRENNAFLTDADTEAIKEKLVSTGVTESDAQTLIDGFVNTTKAEIETYRDALSDPVFTEAVKSVFSESITESERIKADIDKTNKEAVVADTAESPRSTNEEAVAPTTDEYTKDEAGLTNLLKNLNINADESSFRYDTLEGDEARKYLRGLEAAYTLQRSGVDPTKNDFTFKDSLTENEINVMAGYAKEAREAQGKADQAVKDAAIKETEVKEEPAEKPKKKLTPAQLKKNREKIAKRILKRGAKASKNREDIFSKAIVYDGKQYITDGFLMVAMPEGEFLDIPTWETEKPGYGKMLSDILARSRGEADTPSPIEDIDDVSTLREYAEYKKVDKDPYVFKDQSRGFNAEYLADLLEMIPDAEQYYAVGTKNALSAIFVTDGNIEGYLLPVRVSDLAKGRRITEVALSNLEYLRNKNSSEKETTTKESPKPKGSVRGYNVSVKELQEGFNENQKFAYKIMTAVAQARNLNIVLYDSQKGNIPPELADSNGAYSPSTRTMFIDLSAGLNPKVKTDVGNLANYTLLQTFSHEFTHMLESDAPAQYQKFQEFVFDTMAERGQDVNKLIVTKQAIYKNLDYDEASREVIADSMVNILNDETVLNKLYEQDRNFVQKLFDSLKKFISEIKAYFERTFAHGNTVEAQAIMDGINYVDGIAEQFNKLLESKPSPLQQELIKNTPKTDSEATIAAIEGTADGAVEANAYTDTLKGEMQFSQRTYEEAMPKVIMPLSTTGNQKMVTAKDVPGGVMIEVEGTGQKVYALTGKQVTSFTMLKNGYKQAQVDRINEFMSRMSEFMEEMGVHYTFIGLDDVKNAKLKYTYDGEGNITGVVLSAMVKNGEYAINFDLSTICKKREAVTRVIEALGEAIDRENNSLDLSHDDLMAINEALKEEGYETACLGCFVESKRFNAITWAREFCKKWNDAVKRINPNATYFNFSKGEEKEITTESVVNFESARRQFDKKQAKDRADKAFEEYKEKAANGETLLEGQRLTERKKVYPNTFNKEARKRLRNSDLTEAQKNKYLNADVSTLDLEDVRILLDAGVIAGKSVENEVSINNLVASGEVYQHLLRPSDLLTAKGMAQLKSLDNFNGVMYGHYGSATPKPIQAYTPYNSEIALLPAEKGRGQWRMSLAKYLYKIAGVRMQSFSDFQIQNIYDYLQIVADLAARKLPSHAYTKEISFAKLLGMTGIKTNLSVMFDIDPTLREYLKGYLKKTTNLTDKEAEAEAVKIARDHGGLTLYDPKVHNDENYGTGNGKIYGKIVLKDQYGEWVYNVGDYATQQAYKKAYPDSKLRFTQSIGFADAVKLQMMPGYTKNCGIIAVGYSDLHILAMLNDSRIRYIIPYHASSLPDVIKVLTHIGEADEYTATQNTTKIKSITDANGNAVEWSIKKAAKRTGSTMAAIQELTDHINNDGWKVETEKAEGGHGAFDLYADLDKTSDPRQTARNYIEWCGENNTLPVFYQFANHNNYYKLVYDFNVFDNVTEEYAPMEAVQNIYPTLKNGKIVPSNIANEDFDPTYLQKTAEKQMAFMNEQNRNLKRDTANLAQNVVEKGLFKIERSVPKDSKKQIRVTPEQDAEYLELAEDPRKNERALNWMVKKEAEANGYTTPKLYHGTRRFGFTEFDLTRGTKLLYASTKSNVAGNYGGYNNYASPRSIGKAYRDGNSVEDIIANAETLGWGKYRRATTRDRREVYEKVIKESKEVAKKIDAMWISPTEFEPWEISNAVDWISSLAYWANDRDNYFDETEEKLRREEREEWQHDIEKYQELMPTLKEWYEENYDSLPEDKRKYVSYLLGVELADLSARLDGGLLNAITEHPERMLIRDNGQLRSADELKAYFDEEHTVGSYQLYGNVGDNPFEVDAGGTQWYGVKVPEIGEKTYSTDKIAEWAREQGYTSVIVRNVYDGGDQADDYIFFDTNQVKSADSVTYDSDGNVIPLSERFNPANNDLRYQRKTTTEEDAEYEEAYFDGDDERMQELVDKAAYDAGYKYKAYHHTENAFTVFDINKARRTMDVQGFYFSADPEAESEYGSVRYDTYLKMDNPYIVDSKAKLDAIPVKFGVDDYGVKVREWLQDHGYDSVIRKADYYGAEADEYIVFKPNQIKSAEPVVYADDENGEGDFIPISERFNPRKKDMRFQRRNDWRLGDWEILSRAANNLESSNYNAEQKKALAFFQSKLTALQNLQEKRNDLGSLFHDQMFTKGGDKKAAQNTLKQMNALDAKIEKAANEVTKATESKVVRDLLKEARSVIETQEREHGAELLRRYRDRRDNSEAIAKYKKKVLTESRELQKWITNPNDKAAKRVPDVLRNSVVNFLSLIDETSTRQLKGGAATQADAEFAKRLRNLRDAIKTNVEATGLYSGYNDLPENFFDELQYNIDMVEALTNRTDTFVLNAMTSTELKQLAVTITAIKRYIQNMNAFLNNAAFAHVADAAEDSIESMQKLKEDKIVKSGIFNYFLWTQMRPAYAWSRFGKGGEAIFDELRKGQGQLAFNAAEIIDFTNKLYTDKEVSEWSKETKTFDINGDKVEVPVSYIMSLYELMKQEDSRRHIFGRGLRFAAFKRGLKKFADSGHTITDAKVMEIVNSLTDRQKEVADGLQRYMATVGAEWGNYVSMKRFGRQAFTNPSYFPIFSDGRWLDAAAEEKPSNASLYALLNASFTKGRDEKANNRLVVYDIFDVFANHMASMAQYNAFALPILDALKWLNYKTYDAQGNELGVKDAMVNAFGKPIEKKGSGSGSAGYAETFVTNIIKAFNGTESQANPTDNVGLNLLRRYNMAQIAYNLRVVVQQPMAIVRAASILNGLTLTKGAVLNLKNLKANIEEMNQYSGIAKLKDLGYYDTNISRGLTQQIKHDDSLLDKAGEIGMKPAEFMDSVTWAAIWVASKEEAKKQGYSGSELLEKAADIFEDVIYKTQVVDSVLTKTEYMRNKGGIARMLSSFMSEPVTTASMVVDAIDQYNRDIRSGATRQEAFKKHGANFARITAVYCVNAIMLACAEAAIDAFRDDDDDPYPEKYGKKFLENFLDELNPFGKYPIIKDIEEMVKGLLQVFGVETRSYSPRTLLGQGWEQFIKGSQIIADKINGQKKGYTWYAGIQKLLQGISGLTGTHLGTITRELIATWNAMMSAINPNLKVYNYVSNDDLSGMIFRAAQSNDTDTLRDIESKYYKDEDAFKSAYKSAIGDKLMSGEITEAEAQRLLERYYDADEAHWQIDRWNYKAENGTTEGYAKYDDFYTAVETGQNLKAVIKEYTDNGVDKKTLASQITSHFKPIYVQASKAEKAKLKGYLLNAYELLGYNRKDKSKDIDKWA